MTLSEYSQLTQRIVNTVASSERYGHLLTTLKDLFRGDINSPRRFEQISSIGELLRVLETRDVLSEDNIEPLKIIARRLSNSAELISRIDSYELNHVPREYGDYYAFENRQATLTAREPVARVINLNPYGAVMSPRKKQRINETVVEEIGVFWRDLGRNLKIRECDIDDIDNRSKTLASKATKLMEKYEQRADPQRWFFVLCEALDKARRRDLSKTLQEIMTMNI